MNRNESILAGVIACSFILAMSVWGYAGHLCKIEAIKAGMKGQEVVTACR